MASRLQQLGSRLGKAAGRSLTLRMGYSGFGARVNEDGSITLDSDVVWRLSEAGLTALVAHEAGHVVLGHVGRQVDLGTEPRESAATAAGRHRLREREADEFAGRMVGLLSGSREGFDEALEVLRSTAWEGREMQQIYTHDQRRAAFERGLGSVRQDGVATRPSGIGPSGRG